MKILWPNTNEFVRMSRNAGGEIVSAAEGRVEAANETPAGAGVPECRKAPSDRNACHETRLRKEFRTEAGELVS